MRRSLAAVAIVMSTSAIGIPAEADGPARPVSVAVETTRGLYVDGYDNAAFTTDGCVPASDIVVPASEACAPSSGKVRGALLGFDAAHHVDAGAVDVPAVEVSASRLQQVSRVIVDLDQPGTLRVELAFTPVAGLTARPQPASASPSVTESGETSVAWIVHAAAPGRHVFSVPFAGAVGASDAHSYRPAATVTLTGDRAALFDTAEGPIAADEPVVRDSRLVMAQHVAPREGPPAFSDGGWMAAPGSYGLPGAWANTVEMTGFGHHHTMRHGQRTGAFRTPYERLAPGGGHALTGMSSLSAVIALDKVEMVHGSSFGGTIEWGLRTSSTGPDQFNRVSPTAGIIWDGDSVRAAHVVSGAALRVRRGNPPANNDGQMTFLDAGTEARAWASTVAGSAPAGEGNTFNPRLRLNEQIDATLITARSISFIVREGDIDNTGGADPIKGPTLDIRPPPGKTFAYVSTSVLYPVDAKIDATTVTDRGDTGLSLEGVTLTPYLGAGGHWLESQRDGYVWDWGGHISVTAVVGDPFFPELPQLHYAQTITVPRGMAAVVNTMAATGTMQQLRFNDPGQYTIVNGLDGLTARRVSP